KVEVEIPVVLTGEPIAPAAAFVDLQTLTLLVDALNVPEQVEVDVEGSEDGFQVFAGDVTLPEGSELVSDVELLVASVALPRIDETEVEEGEESEASAEPAEADEDSAEEEGSPRGGRDGRDAVRPLRCSHLGCRGVALRAAPRYCVRGRAPAPSRRRPQRRAPTPG